MNCIQFTHITFFTQQPPILLERGTCNMMYHFFQICKNQILRVLYIVETRVNKNWFESLGEGNILKIFFGYAVLRRTATASETKLS